MVRPHVAQLLAALLVCFNDDSWPVRDGEYSMCLRTLRCTIGFIWCVILFLPVVMYSYKLLCGRPRQLRSLLLCFSIVRCLWKFRALFSRGVKVSKHISYQQLAYWAWSDVLFIAYTERVVCRSVVDLLLLSCCTSC